MEPTPPKTSRISKKFNRPFYEAKRKTSAEIVSEARSSLRTLQTKRPFTPAEPNRTLFSGTTEKQDGRPPSACSIALSYTDSRPPTGKKLSPIEDLEKNKNKSGSAKSCSSKSNIDGDLKRVNNANVLYEELEANQESSYMEKFQLTTEHQGIRVNSGPVNRTPPDWTALKQRPNSSGDIVINQVDRHSDNKENSKKVFFNDNIKPLLKQMELNHLHGDDDSLLVNFDILWKTLYIGNMIGKSQLGSKRRSEILSSVYKCTSGDNVRLLLKLSRLFLTLEVTGKNLEVVCKLMLKVSRNKKHDELFVEEMLVGLLLNLLKFPQQLDMTNCLVYLTGIIKFLSMNSVIINEMIKYDVLQSISSLLQFTIEEFSDNDIQIEQSCHMLVQITSALVNFANIASVKNKFISYGILQQLLDLTETRYKDSDYFMNVARLLSKLTMDEHICHEISKITFNYNILFNGLKFNYQKANISVRICFMFGNIAHYCHNSREHLAYEYNGIELVVEIANYYLKLLDDSEKTPAKDIEDVLIKIMRIIANLSMDEKCGISFSDYQGCIDVLCHIINLMEKKHLSDELQISCATTLNNLSYFAASDSILIKNEETITLGMIDMLLSENVYCVLEAMRVLGNFTKSKVVRDILINNEVFDVLLSLLESSHPDVIFCTCGVLVNIMVDNNNRSQLKDGGITKLINVLKEFAESDWSLAGLVCKLLWNYSEKIITATDTFGMSETDDLITLLSELLEPVLALDYESRGDLDDKAIEVLKDTWNLQFKPVACQLLKKIDMHHSDLIPIVSAPD